MSKGEPFISLIIPAYNRALVIQETLQSILDQTYTNWECLVVDDGSSDTTAAVVNAFAKADNRIQYLQRPTHKPKGANACRNYGFEKSKGTHINWLDSDDLLATTHFKNHIQWHQEQPIAASVSVVATFQEDITNKQGLWANPFPSTNSIDDMCVGDISWQTASVLWKREVLPEKPFDERLQSAQEWTFHTQQAIKKITFKVFDTTTVYVRRHDARTGKDFSAQKYKSMFLSRHLIFKELKNRETLTVTREQGLLKRMFQAAKGAARARYLSTSLWQWQKLIQLLPQSRYKKQLIRVILLGIPLYLILGKGEQFFKL